LSLAEQVVYFEHHIWILHVVNLYFELALAGQGLQAASVDLNVYLGVAQVFFSARDKSA
jgi:hypothetical protein